MARPTKVEITEVGPRDGLQAELNFIPTDADRFVNGLIAAGVLNRILVFCVAESNSTTVRRGRSLRRH